MNVFAQEQEFQPRTWAQVPRGRPNQTAWVARANRPGVPGMVEIRPHNDRGRRRGAADLRTRMRGGPWAGHDGWLVTYVALGADGNPLSRGRPAAVRLLAEQVGGPSPSGVFDLGVVPLPATIPFPRVDLPGFFGSAVEEPIRQRLTELLVRHARRTVDTATGGATPGPDLVWREVAQMYGELAQQLRDPFLAELADELAAL